MSTVALTLVGCGSSASRLLAEPPTIGTQTQSATDLIAMPPPSQKLYVAVFSFQDQTGQHKPNDTYADYSFAVTQGGSSILMNALKDAGNQRWFTVLERARLADLFQERQIIRANRSESGQAMQPLGPLYNAGVIFEGGIIGYDTNLLTGGAGATILGIGGSAQYRRDNVAVYLRAVSVLTGEVLVSVTTDKTIYSISLNANANKFVGFNQLIQVEAGVTTNEPGQLAVKQAIELAVHNTILEGASRGVWSFADSAAQDRLLKEYAAIRNGKAQPVTTANSTAVKHTGA
jgi:curli production assembly/transport component CsgG